MTKATKQQQSQPGELVEAGKQLSGWSLGISPARILEWVDISLSRVSSRVRDQTPVSCVFCIGIYTHIHSSPTPLPSRLPHNTEQSSDRRGWGSPRAPGGGREGPTALPRANELRRLRGEGTGGRGHLLLHKEAWLLGPKGRPERS